MSSVLQISLQKVVHMSGVVLFLSWGRNLDCSYQPVIISFTISFHGTTKTLNLLRMPIHNYKNNHTNANKKLIVAQ